MTRLTKFLPVWFSFLLLIAGPLRALEVQQVIWGFDGHVVADTFNPVSVLVVNPGSNTFDGGLTLTSADGPGSRGVEFVQPIFLAPHASRWVQFYVRTGDGAGSYAVRWGRGAHDGYEMDGPIKGGPPACVWLRDTENPFALAGSLKSFPDQLFPTTASAAEGLDAVVLDHTPRWEPARREAFLDWVKLGGTVHLLPDAAGHLPIFGEGLEALDTQTDATNVGRGRVVHHNIAAREMSERYLQEHGYPPRTMATSKNPAMYDLDGVIFRKLSALTKPKVSWTVVIVLVIAYVVVIGPVHNHFRRRLDYRVSILVFLGCVTVFGVALGVTGRRGYNESQTVNSLAIAHAVGGGRVDVTQWISAFATQGDRYTLSHRSAANLYTTDRGAESGSGLIFNGKDGRIQLDIPLYSARAFLHRAIMTGEDTSVTVEKWDATRGSVLKELRLKTAAGFPAHPEEIEAVYNGQIYKLTQRNGGLELSGATPEPLSTHFSHESLSTLTRGGNPFEAGEPETPLHLMPLLLAQAAKVPEIFPTMIAPSNHRPDLQLLIVAPLPASFQTQGPGFTRESGWVLYVQDVFKP